MVTDIGYAVFLFIKQNPVSVRQFEPFLGFDETMDDGNLLQGLRCAVIEQNDHWFLNQLRCSGALGALRIADVAK